MRFPDSYRSALTQKTQGIPGAIAKRGRLGPPMNMAGLVGVSVPMPHRPFRLQKDAPPWLEDWLTSYQRAGLAFASNRDGALILALWVRKDRCRDLVGTTMPGQDCGSDPSACTKTVAA